MKIPLISGHRGTRVHQIENTRAAFEFCLEHNFDYIEFDVKKTRDNKLIIFHDRYVNRLLSGKGKTENLTLSKLRKMAYKDGQKVQTLSEFFEQVGKQVIPMLEIKSRNIGKQVIDLVHKYGYEGREILIQSFQGKDIEECYKIDPQFDYGLCMAYLGKFPFFKKRIANFMYKRNIQPYPFVKWLNLDGPFIYDEFMGLLHKKDHKIILGARNTEKYLPNIEKWHIDVINCDDGLKIRKLLKKMS